MRSLGFTEAQIDRAMARTSAMSPEEQRLFTQRSLSEILPDVPCSITHGGDYCLDLDALLRAIQRRGYGSTQG